MKINFSVSNNRIKDFGIRNVDKMVHSCGFEVKSGYKNKPTNALSFGGFKISNLPTVWKTIKPYLNPIKEGFSEEKIPKYLSANVPKWAEKLGSSEKFENLVAIVRDKPAIFQALVELGIVGVVRSLIVVATPGVKKGDKETSISKNIVSALTGYALSNLVFRPIGAATKKVLKDPENYLKEGSSMLKKMQGAGLDNVAERTMKNSLHTLLNKGPDILLAPVKSALTVALIPVVMGILFKDNPKGKKIGKNANQAENQNQQNDQNVQQAPSGDVSSIIIDKNIRNALGALGQKGVQE